MGGLEQNNFGEKIQSFVSPNSLGVKNRHAAGGRHACGGGNLHAKGRQHACGDVGSEGGEGRTGASHLSGG